MNGFSVLNPPQQQGSDGQDSTLVDLVRAAVERHGADAWKVWLDDMRCIAADYGVGLAGVIAFLLRLRHGGPQMWMADPTTVGAAQC
ncbi:MAG: hypothetical protein ACRDYX_19810 [Egibacteraceae bacterium]